MKGKTSEFQQTEVRKFEEKDEGWFLSQLEQHCSEVVVKRNDFSIHCPNPDHPDNNPSCNVNRLGGYWKCWSCGAGGGWNDLATLIGAERLGYQKEKKAGKAKEALSRALKKAGVKPKKKKKKVSRPLTQAWQTKKSWRDVPGALLSAIGCIQVTDLVHTVVRIGLPVRTVSGDLMGYTCRAIEPEDVVPKYTPLSADATQWRERELPAKEAMFLIDFVLAEGWDAIVIVEGPYDALRLVASGIPAIAILGTSNWSSFKKAVIEGLGLKAVLVFMDNDDSGRKAQGMIISDLKGSVKVDGILPPKDRDPGDITVKQCEWVKKRLEDLKNS